MGIKTVEITAKKVNRRKRNLKIAKIAGLIVFLLLLIIFLVLRIIYNGGRFTITLDPNMSLKTGLIIYEDKVEKRSQRRLFAKELEFMDNISVKWLPKNINEQKDGTHNGENYLAYTFYAENTGKRTIDYWYEIDIDDVTRNVDEAIRIMIYLNGKQTIYGKINGDTKTAEDGTKTFYSNKIPVLEERSLMPPGAVDKFTIVIYLEGDDPDCLNNLIGGEIKMHMDITESHIEEKKNG